MCIHAVLEPSEPSTIAFRPFHLNISSPIPSELISIFKSFQFSYQVYPLILRVNTSLFLLKVSKSSQLHISCTCVSPKDAACFMDALKISSLISFVFFGMILRTRSIAFSFNIPVASPVNKSLSIIPPGGLGVDLFIPAAFKAALFDNAIWPSILVTKTGFFEVILSIHDFEGSMPPQFS